MAGPTEEGRPDGPAGLLDVARLLWDDLHLAASERLKLLGLELRLAGMTLLQLVIYAVVVAVLVVTAWLGLMGGVVVGFVQAGLHWAVALGLGILVNLLVAAWMVRAMLRMIERVAMPASLRRWRGRGENAKKTEDPHAAEPAPTA